MMIEIIKIIFKFVLRVVVGFVIVVSILYFGISYDREIDPNRVPYDYTCTRPEEVPDTMRGGTPIYWDCDWNASYYSGNVTILRDSLERVTSIGRAMI